MPGTCASACGFGYLRLSALFSCSSLLGGILGARRGAGPAGVRRSCRERGERVSKPLTAELAPSRPDPLSPRLTCTRWTQSHRWPI